MLSKEKLFGNQFDDVEITPARLVGFADDFERRAEEVDIGNALAGEVATVKAARVAVSREIAEVDQTLTRQLGRTGSVDAVIAAFIGNMRENEGVIAKALGGKESAGFLEFFPSGMSEYNRMSKTDAPTLIARVNAAAINYSAQLGTALKDELMAHEPAWTAARGAQGDAKADVGSNRGERNVHRQALELALTAAVHAVGRLHPGDVAACSRYFRFHLLEAPRHSSLERDEPGDEPA